MSVPPVADNQFPFQRSFLARGGDLLELIGKYVAILVPTMYLLGRVYCETYWDALGLSESLIQYSFEDRIYWGFYVFFSLAVDILGWMPGGPIGAVFLTTIVIAFLAVAFFFFNKILVPEIKLKVENSVKMARAWRLGDKGAWIAAVRPFAGFLIFVQNLLLYFFLMVVILAVPILISVQAGRDSASRIAKRLEISAPLDGALRMPLIKLKDPIRDSNSAILVQCSSEWCAIWVRERFMAVRKESINSVEACYQVGITKTGLIACEWVDFRGG